MFKTILVILFGNPSPDVPTVYSYIDPGTGSMLFTIAIGIVSTVIYSLKGLFIKLKSRSSKNTPVKDTDSHKYVIFSDSKRYWNVFEGICEEFEKRNIPVLYLTMSEDDEAFTKQYEHIERKYIGNSNAAFSYLNLLKADILLSTTPGLDVYQWKRSRNVKYYVHVPHMVNDITTYRMFGLDYYDAVLCVNSVQKKQIERLEKIRNINNKELEVVGCTYFDRLNNQLKKAQHKRNDVPVVLVAPSWGKSAILSKYGSSILDELVKTGYRIVVRPHPQSFTAEKELIETLMAKYPDIEWNKDADNFEILNRSDILISDFSGVIFDYALVFDKPVIFSPGEFDKSPYDAWWLDENLWTFDVLPQFGAELKSEGIKDIKNIIDVCLKDKENKDKKAIKETAWPEVGNSSRMIVDYMVKKEEEICR